ncbi:hypothetical protein [Marinomonas ostreistagni]|uniref:hypothetical protein n=1 Tax=Marinomonas ostreistagni TaxID=359209 RepID=UPI00194F8BD0|nr:hypothetical protein [Marinomonas ostreistagni]MBM6552202.1 hypothetical protein [Marinomonas ostreistagni]
MTYKVTPSDLNSTLYSYTWSRDAGDGPQRDGRDRTKLDKDEGYEVLHMIQRVYDYYAWEVSRKVAQVEDHLHSHALADDQDSETIYQKLIQFTYN